MVKELIKVVVIVFITTIVVYPVSNVFADIMTAWWEVNLMNTIIIGIVRYIGFFMGLGLLMYIYRGRNTNQYSYSSQNPYMGGP